MKYRIRNRRVSSQIDERRLIIVPISNEVDKQHRQEQILGDLEVLDLYLAVRDQYPTQALANTRVIALMGMTSDALIKLHESLSKQVKNPNPIDMYLYGDHVVPRYLSSDLVIPFISLFSSPYQR